MKILLASLLALTPVSASADDVIGWETTSKTCYRETYREEYIPGTKNDPGFVRTFSELIEVPCRDNIVSDPIIRRETVVEYDDNDCTDGKVAGAVIGGGLGAAISRDDGRWWAIPLGAVVGSKIGCDAAGG
jgi:hypothetical protein|tara:strand:+ start:1272 stop:1664 length:393 start_codon:yes stop_codon:yes gene_type:complete